ncbi:acetyl-CoA carboxylase biotin carboxyl carrier protein subunit [Chachezhania sediminis]|uniref:acetyl-CoA carboxylase biotin carboxyl carrier protein subunit n=1 Tax=Chachezhania sediminis TaxID=2599291 RepID=UPI00131C0D17|nr:acetyl-CoA carboxylase biotin carboxyl carrier protein subunit [Chachezhania sediminis]
MATKVQTETGGAIWKCFVRNGQAVAAGEELFIMEVMKMEVPYEAPVAGIVTDLSIAEGDVVPEDHVALVLT